MNKVKTTQEWQSTLGRQVRTLRLLQDLDQRVLAARAGVGVTALKNLEHGAGVSVLTLVKVLRALDRAEWLETLAPTVSINPLQMVKRRSERQRASGLKQQKDKRT